MYRTLTVSGLNQLFRGFPRDLNRSGFTGDLPSPVRLMCPAVDSMSVWRVVSGLLRSYPGA
jgi:hypothetical protein